MSYALLDDDGAQLCCAIRSGNISDVQILVEAGVDINSQDKNGETALHVATWYDCEDVVQELLDSGVDVSQPNTNGQTPLHLAAGYGYSDIARHLLDASANIEAKTKYTEMSALHLASMNGHTQTVVLLLDYGADTRAIDVIKKTADYYAANREITDIFTEEEARQKLHGKKISLKILAKSHIALNKGRIRKPIMYQKSMYSPKHEHTMQLNVFDRLTRRKSQLPK